MVTTDDVRKSHAFIAVIHKKNVTNKKQFDHVVMECKLAKALGKPMYALVKTGVDIGVLNNMPWRKMLYFNNAFELTGIIKFIDEDIKAGGFYT